MRRKKIALLALVVASFASGAVLPVAAQSEAGAGMSNGQQATAQRRRFELSAMVTAPGTLSRSDIDRNSLGMGSLGQATKRASVASSNQIASTAGVPKSDNDQLPPGNIDEYNVDWSHWVSKQADRWYYNLKMAETLLNLQFVSVRPAMIQFTCYADGTIGNIVLRQSSGIPAYDRLQIETLRATQPVAAFPAGTRRSSITLCQGWESHPKQAGESDFQPGSFGRDFPAERVRQWRDGR